jgi:ribosomal protein S18 acetylase RimI-like enzyme
MGILAPYRSRGVGSESLSHLLNSISKRPAAQKIHRIYMHVQISNDSAKRFYEKNGFKEVGIHEGYYKKISPHDAWILEKVFD